MGLFDKIKGAKGAPAEAIGFDEKGKQIAINTLTEILRAFHEKKFANVLSCVDKSEVDDLEDYLTDFMQGTLEINDFDAIDEYGAECNFKPKYEYSQLDMDEYSDKSGFYLEYEMTSGGDLVDMTLQLKFIYNGNNLKRIFENVEPQ